MHSSCCYILWGNFFRAIFKFLFYFQNWFCDHVQSKSFNAFWCIISKHGSVQLESLNIYVGIWHQSHVCDSRCAIFLPSSDGSQPSTFHKVEILSWTILLFLVLCTYIELFYLNSIEQLGNLIGLKEQLEVCLTCWRLLAAIQMLLLHENLSCSNNKMTLGEFISAHVLSNVPTTIHAGK